LPARPTRRRLVDIGPRILIAALGALLVGCGAPAPDVSAPATLSPDGSVPWVDEPGSEAELATPPPRRRPIDPGAPACAARDLSARLPRWAPKLLHDDEGKLVGNAGLLAMVDIRSASTTACTLRGEVPVTLRAGGTRVDLTYVHNVDDAGRDQ
jgi:hypothetical protein